MNAFSREQSDTMENLNRVISAQKCFVECRIDKRLVGCGPGVIQDGLLGIFDLIVNRQYRTLGIGKSIVKRVLNWGKDSGCELAYLQVFNNNSAAIGLYEKLGFSLLYPYWYRIK